MLDRSFLVSNLRHCFEQDQLDIVQTLCFHLSPYKIPSSFPVTYQRLGKIIFFYAGDTRVENRISVCAFAEFRKGTRNCGEIRRTSRIVCEFFLQPIEITIHCKMKASVCIALSIISSHSIRSLRNSDKRLCIAFLRYFIAYTGRYGVRCFDYSHAATLEFAYIILQ